MTIRGPVSDAEIADVWPKVEAMLGAAIERDGSKLLPIDLLKQLSDGLMGLYLIEDDATGEIIAALACDVQEYARSTVFNIAYCGGRDLYRWAGLLGAMEAEAASMSCDTLRITGRAGWGRVFPDYREMCRVFERRIVQ